MTKQPTDQLSDTRSMQPQHFMEFHDDQLSKRLGFSRIQNPFSQKKKKKRKKKILFLLAISLFAHSRLHTFAQLWLVVGVQ